MSFWIRFKSSITGLFVKKSFADANKETTYAAKVEHKPAELSVVDKFEKRVQLYADKKTIATGVKRINKHKKKPKQ